MVHYHRYQQWKKGNTESQGLTMEFSHKRTKPKFLPFFCAFLLFCSFAFWPYLFTTFSVFNFYSSGLENDFLVAGTNLSSPPCPSISTGTLSCDRSSIRSDICIMKGDIRTQSSSSSIFLYSKNDELKHERIKPYTRKWETSVMDIVSELNLVMKKENSNIRHECDVLHAVPTVFFSTGGYTGNIYHEFNDGIIPLFITSQHLRKKVVFVISEYHNWWVSKYGNILSQLSDYQPINFNGDRRTHCFPEAIVGLKIHDELSVDSSLMIDNKNILDFRALLDRAYRPRIKSLIQKEERVLPPPSISSVENQKPKMVILSRIGSRVILNENEMVKMAEKMGFLVEILRPGPTTELARIYQVLNSSNVLIGVHGAAMTHFLFLRPGSVLIQVIPLGTEWPAENYYGRPASRFGLKYVEYKILRRESSLVEKYDRNDPVLRDPAGTVKKGWEYTKKIYLDDQNVRLNLERFQKRLARSYYYSVAAIRRNNHRRSR